jgi:uncharacterized RDD family membrane protein YckC
VNPEGPDDERQPSAEAPPAAAQAPAIWPPPPPGAPATTSRPPGAFAAPGVQRSGGPCPTCGREWGGGPACQFCGQVDGLPVGVRLSSVGKRFGAYLLDAIFVVVTLGVGWFVWALIVWGYGQTPGKQVLGMRTVNLRAGARASWGRMFLREFVAKGVIAIVATFTFGLGLLLYLWLVWDKANQELWDKMADTVVVDDPQKEL